MIRIDVSKGDNQPAAHDCQTLELQFAGERGAATSKTVQNDRTVTSQVPWTDWYTQCKQKQPSMERQVDTLGLLHSLGSITWVLGAECRLTTRKSSEGRKPGTKRLCAAEQANPDRVDYRPPGMKRGDGKQLIKGQGFLVGWGYPKAGCSGELCVLRGYTKS